MPRGELRIKGLRGGTISEITEFLVDFEGAYISFYSFEATLLRWRRARRYWPDFFFREELFGIGMEHDPDAPEYIVPTDRLELSRVLIESPGFWEFAGALNPLQQLREYLKDRHERRKDHLYRESAEKERLELENELLQAQILEKEGSILRSQILTLRELGYSQEEIRELVWTRLGPPLSRLGRHQDRGLIEGPEEEAS